MNNLNFLTTKQLADELAVPVSCVQRWGRMRLIPSVHIGWRTRLYDPAAVRVALEKLTIREQELMTSRPPRRLSRK